MNPVFEIALAVNVGITHLERVVRGIRGWAESNADWRFLVSPETHYLSPADLAGWQGDGVIALANREEDFRVLSSLDCPVVNLSGAREDPVFPRVRPDYEAIGTIAAHHLIERGYRRFGFYGMGDVWYSRQYEKGFAAGLSEREMTCSTLHVPSTLGEHTRWDTGQEELENWLKTLQPPFAVMAAHDPRAAMVIRSCEKIGLRVPEDVAVIGVNNDTVACESCRPELTSIERNDSAIGKEAARLLDYMIRGESAPESELVVAPGKVVERASTDSIGVDDPGLLPVLEFVGEHFREPISVPDLVSACPRSRRWLETAFAQNLNCTPREYLARLRLREAQRLRKQHPDMGPGELALKSGFTGTRQLNLHFREAFGKSFKEFR